MLFCFGIYLLFQLLRKYRISKFLRRFYFIKTVLAVTVLEENLGYFVFICFSNISQLAFTFNMADKLSLGVTLLFLFCLCFFSFCFYFLTGKYLGKKASYFAESTYRENAGFSYKIIQLLLRNILRALAFFYFFQQYRIQLVLLILVEILVMILSIVI